MRISSSDSFLARSGFGLTFVVALLVLLQPAMAQLAPNCLPPLDDDVNLSGPALAPIYMPGTVTANNNGLTPLNPASELRAFFHEVDYHALKNMSAGANLTCNSVGSPLVVREIQRLAGRASARGKRFHLLLTLSVGVDYQLSGRPDVGGWLYVNDALVFSSLNDAPVWDGVGDPCNAPQKLDTIQMVVAVGVGEKLELRAEAHPEAVNYQGNDRLIGNNAGITILDVAIVDIEEDPRSRCDSCRFEGCGAVSIGSAAFEMSVGTPGFDSPVMGQVGRLCLGQRYVTDPTAPVAGSLFYFDTIDEFSLAGKDLITGRIQYIHGVNGTAHLSYTSEDDFEIDWYSHDQVGNSPPYTPTGSADRSYQFNRSTVGTVTTVTVDEVIGSTTLTSTFTWDSATEVLTLDHPGGLRRDVRDSNLVGSVREDTYEVIEPLNGNLLVRKDRKRYEDLGWGEVLISKQMDPDNGGETTTYAYVTDSNANGYQDLDSVASSYGPKVFFDYNSDDLLEYEYWGWKDQPAIKDVNQGRSRQYRYDPIPQAPDDGSWKPKEPRAIWERINGVTVRQSYLILDQTQLERTEVEFADTNTIFWSYWTNGKHPRTITRFESTPGTFQGFPVRVEGKDYTDVISYSLDTVKKERTVTAERQGAWKFGTPYEGYITVQKFGEAGHLIEETVTERLSSIELSQTTYDNFDDHHRPQLITHKDGTTEVLSYGCCGMDSMTDRDGVVTSYSYDNLRRRVSGSRLGIETFWDYDAADHLVSIRRRGTDASEITLQSWTYGLDGHATQDTNGLLGQTSTQRSILSGGQLQRTLTRPDGGTLIETHYLDGQLASITGTAAIPEAFDAVVESITVGSKTWGCMVRRRTALDELGNLTSEWSESKQLFDGRPSEQRYAASGGSVVETINYAGGSVRPYKVVDGDGVATYFGYDQYDPNFRQKWQGIDFSGDDQLTEASSDRIEETLYEIDTYTDGGTTYDVIRTQQKVYPTNGNGTPVLIAESLVSTDGLRAWDINYPTPTTSTITRTEISYNGNQRTETITHPTGIQSVREFTDGRLVTEKRVDTGASVITQTTLAYGPHGRVASQTDLRNGATDFTYNNADQVLTVTSSVGSDGNRQTTTTTYDTSLRPIQVQQPDGTSVYTHYDFRNQVVKQFGSRTYPVEFTYDAQGRKRTQTTWKSFDETTGFGISGSAVTRWNYDPHRGWLISKDYANEANGQAPVTEGTGGPVYTYSDAGRLLTRTWQRGVITTNAYDTTSGELDTVTYSDGTPALDYTYNRRGETTSIAQGTTTTSYTFDDVGNVLTETVTGGPNDGAVFTRNYDSSQRLTSDSLDLSSNSLATATYGYSATTGRLASVFEGSTGVTYSYVPNSDLIASKTHGSGSLVTSQTYDFLNRLTHISNQATGEVDPVSFHYSYNLANQRTRAEEVDGKYWEYQYDALGQVTDGDHCWNDGVVIDGQGFDYDFDEIGNRKTTGGRASAVSTYTTNHRNEYDDRTVAGVIDVLGVDDPTATVTVEGQATARSGEYFHAEVTVDNTANPRFPELDVTTTSSGGQTVSGKVYIPEDAEVFTHDDDGNLLSDGRWNYTWDAENRLKTMTHIAFPTGDPALETELEPAELRIEFDYDHQNRRIRKRVYDEAAGGTLKYERRYFYDGWNIVAETNGTGTLLRRYLWGTDLSGTFQGAGGVGGLLAIVDHTGASPEVHYVSNDGNGNVVALSEAVGGTFSARYEYGPFGEPVRQTGDPIAWENPYRFSTKVTDDESGILYYGMRLYNPSTGRWLSKDPIEEAGGLNLYGFVHNDGINFFDILGLDPEDYYLDVDDERLDLAGQHGYFFGTLPYDQDTYDTYSEIDERAARELLWIIDIGSTVGAEVNLPAAIALGVYDFYNDPSWWAVLAMVPGVPRMPDAVSDRIDLFTDRYGTPKGGGGALDALGFSGGGGRDGIPRNAAVYEIQTSDFLTRDGRVLVPGTVRSRTDYVNQGPVRRVDFDHNHGRLGPGHVVDVHINPHNPDQRNVSKPRLPEPGEYLSPVLSDPRTRGGVFRPDR